MLTVASGGKGGSSFGRNPLTKDDPRITANSFDSTVEATQWADDLAKQLWGLGGSSEARLIRRAFSKVSSMLHTALYWKPRINIARVDPTDNRMAFNDMNLELFDWMDNRLCRHKKDQRSIAGPRESGKTILTVEIAPVYSGLPALTRREMAALGSMIDGWSDESKESLITQWTPYVVIISNTETQASRHMRKIYDELLSPNCLLQWDWPTMCKPKLDVGSGRAKATSAAAVEFESNLRIEAYGIKTGMLGSRHASMRPSYAVMDDIEPGLDWSPDAAKARRIAIRDVVLPLSRTLRALLIATPQTPNSTADILARSSRGELDPVSEEWEWAREWNATVISPWRLDDDGNPTRETFWEGYLTAEFLDNEMNKTTWDVSYDSRPEPKYKQATWWTRDLFVRRPLADKYERIVCFIDPKKKEGVKDGSRAAWCVVGWIFSEPYQVIGGGAPKSVGRELCHDVMEGLEKLALPHLDALYYEENIVGTSLKYDFRDSGLPQRFGLDAIEHYETKGKEKRAAALQSLYTSKRIEHADTQAIMPVEAGLLMYNGGRKNSDMVDALGGAVRMLSVIRSNGVNTEIDDRRYVRRQVQQHAKQYKVRAR